MSSRCRKDAGRKTHMVQQSLSKEWGHFLPLYGCCCEKELFISEREMPGVGHCQARNTAGQALSCTKALLGTGCHGPEKPQCVSTGSPASVSTGRCRLDCIHSEHIQPSGWPSEPCLPVQICHLKAIRQGMHSLLLLSDHCWSLKTARPMTCDSWGRLS